MFIAVSTRCLQEKAVIDVVERLRHITVRVPAVPRTRLEQAHATSTPDTAQSVSRMSAGLVVRLIKLVVRSRKNSLFYRREIGAEVSDVITSVLATCRRNEVNGLDYPVRLQRHSEAVRRSPESGLPWNYDAAVAELNGTDGENATAA